MNEYFKKKTELPGNSGLPFLGESFSLFDQKQLFYWEHFQQYGKIFKTRILGTNVVCLISPDANRFVLKEQAEKFSSRIGWSILEPLLGEGLLLKDGARHQVTRKLLYPAFHGQAISNYLKIIEDTCSCFFEQWSERKSVDLLSEFRQLSLLIICKIILGIESNNQVQKLQQDYLALVTGIRTVLRWDVPLTKFGRAREARRKLERFLLELIFQRRQENCNNSQNLLNLLIQSTDEDGNQLSDEEIITQILHLLFGGHETIAQLMCWCLFELNGNPEWIKTLKQEQEQVVGSNPLTFSHLKQLTQMSYVFKEVERMYPSVYSIPRGVVEDVEFDGYLIPKGWIVVLSPLLTHRLPELYSQPDRFDPERFAPPRTEDKKHPFALVGFGGGTHRCLGYELAQMEFKVFLSVLLRGYKWKVYPDYHSVVPVRQAYTTERELKARIERL